MMLIPSTTTGEETKETAINEKSKYHQPSLTPHSTHDILHTTATGNNVGILARDGAIGTISIPSDDDWLCPSSNHYSEPTLLSFLSYPSPPPGPNYLWPPTVAIDSSTCPIHGYPTTPVNEKDQQPDGPVIPDHALLPNDELRSTDFITCFHTVSTRGTIDSPTTKPDVTTRIAEQGDQSNPRVS